MIETIRHLQALKFANNIMPGWVTITEIQQYLGKFPKQEIFELIKKNEIKHVRLISGSHAFYIENEPILKP